MLLVIVTHSPPSQQVVLFPVLAGAFLNQYFQPLVKLVSPLMPPMAVAVVAIICGNAIAQSSSSILMSGGQVILASSLLHASGFFFGYVLARMVGIDVSSSRTISIEVGMQVKLALYNYNIIHRLLCIIARMFDAPFCGHCFKHKVIYLSLHFIMQNSALGIVLATKHFGDPLTAVPCAVSSVIQAIFGSMLAGFWRQSVPADMKD